jgi:hypothetical protein
MYLIDTEKLKKEIQEYGFTIPQLEYMVRVLEDIEKECYVFNERVDRKIHMAMTIAKTYIK